jgi:hypothetical protein
MSLTLDGRFSSQKGDDDEKAVILIPLATVDRSRGRFLAIPWWVFTAHSVAASTSCAILAQLQSRITPQMYRRRDRYFTWEGHSHLIWVHLGNTISQLQNNNPSSSASVNRAIDPTIGPVAPVRSQFKGAVNWWLRSREFKTVPAAPDGGRDRRGGNGWTVTG